ncbi:MAG: tetratricopeptide repeat protein [Hyphomonadaceae bacterium]|nr:tetratricopeptide repeat protein [Hyphomonadaceae bacterium]
MRAQLAALATLFVGFAGVADAIPYFPPPQPIYEAPIDRALANVAAMEGVDEAQRERLMARLNLLAYARNDGTFAYLRENDQLNEGGAQSCLEAARNRPMRGPDEPMPDFAPEDLCAQWSFALGPQEETPNAVPQNLSPQALARLEAARDHYARAIELDDSNLRARLGYAYVLDRLGEMDEARAELRRLIALGMPQVAGPQSDWETHAVLTEAVAHLSHIASSYSDRKRLRALQKRLEQSQPMIYVTPIVVPMRDAPFAQLVDTESDVAFDLAGTGDRRAQGWLTPDAAWLVWDPQWRGRISSGFDLIGQRSWSVFWNDGFEALRSLDDNGDGELTGAELDGLALWRDENSNGLSEPGEVLPANVHGVTAIATRGATLRAGLMAAESGVHFDDGSVRPLYDWTPGLADDRIS